MKWESALELDLDEGSLRWSSWFAKLGLTFAFGLGLLIWSIKVGDVVQQWTRPLVFPSTFKISPLLKARSAQKERYFFSQRVSSFGELDLSRIREMSVAEFEEMILKDTPYNLRERLRLYLPLALKMSEHYQVDPFWVVAIMWTESHFNPHAVSYVRAQGLMQVMPATGTYLIRKMARRQTMSDLTPMIGLKARELPLKDPVLNIELGTYYLSYLLEKFQGSHRLATVAYNMGPNGVMRRLRRQLPTGVRNLYLNKVRRSYQYVTRSYRRYLQEVRPPYASTYVAQKSLRPVYQAPPSPLATFPFETGQKIQKLAFRGTERLESL